MKQRQIFDKYPHYFPETVSAPKSILVNSIKPLAEPSSSTESIDDLYECIKPLIFLGRFTCIIPCSREDSKSYKEVAFGWRKLFVLISTLISIWLVIEIIFDAKHLVERGTNGSLGILQYISSAHFLLLSIFEFIVYLYFLRNAGRFYLIFDKWEDTAGIMKFAADPYLKPVAYILCVTTMVPVAIVICFYCELFRDSMYADTRLANFSRLHRFYIVMLKSWQDVFPYHPCFVVFHILINIWTTVSRSFITPLIIFFSRVLTFQFRKLIENEVGVEISEIPYMDLSTRDKLFWKDLVRKHRAISRLVRTVNNFFSPLIFFWTSLNIYVISIQLFRAWTGSTRKAYFPTYFFNLSFAVETFYFFGTLMCAASIHTSARRILVALETCPKEHYFDEAGRLEHKVNSGPPIGLSGWGCFTITKRFLLKVFNVIFTLEIMLLQSNQTKSSVEDAS